MTNDETRPIDDQFNTENSHWTKLEQTSILSLLNQPGKSIQNEFLLFSLWCQQTTFRLVRNPTWYKMKLVTNWNQLGSFFSGLHVCDESCRCTMRHWTQFPSCTCLNVVILPGFLVVLNWVSTITLNTEPYNNRKGDGYQKTGTTTTNQQPLTRYAGQSPMWAVDGFSHPQRETKNFHHQ